MHILAVGIGGAIGAGLRYFISLVISYHGGFPLATWLVNSIGCLCLSFLLSGSLFNNHHTLKLAVTTGLLGSFTTFSTFSAENINLLQNEQYGLALLYILSSIIMGLVCSFVGFRLAKRGVQV